MAEDPEYSGDAGDHVVAGADSGAHFEPLVRLEKVEVRTGEEDEDVFYKERAKLYRFDGESKIWKERGTGDVKILQHKETKKMRLILRQEKTLKICMNHMVSPAMELKPNPGSDRAWTWTAEDYADGDKQVASFAIKFKNTEVANAFKDQYDAARKNNEKLASGGTPAASAASAPETKSSDNGWKDILANSKDHDLTEEQFKAIWKKYDKDGSNFIDRAEMTTLITDMLRAVLSKITSKKSDAVIAALDAKIPHVVDVTMATVDKNKDGKVSYEEFLGLVKVKF